MKISICTIAVLILATGVISFLGYTELSERQRNGLTKDEFAMQKVLSAFKKDNPDVVKQILECNDDGYEEGSNFAIYWLFDKKVFGKDSKLVVYIENEVGPQATYISRPYPFGMQHPTKMGIPRSEMLYGNRQYLWMLPGDYRPEPGDFVLFKAISDTKYCYIVEPYNEVAKNYVHCLDLD
jgi:hypothetical protein